MVTIVFCGKKKVESKINRANNNKEAINLSKKKLKSNEDDEPETNPTNCASGASQEQFSKTPLSEIIIRNDKIDANAPTNPSQYDIVSTPLNPDEDPFMLNKADQHEGKVPEMIRQKLEDNVKTLKQQYIIPDDHKMINYDEIPKKMTLEEMVKLNARKRKQMEMATGQQK
uniref:Uncharacterized protein n=1 Tax=Panagrolaimus sp. JU765 TaxID=591449 RepID=A0AC34PZP0_9BILA